MAVFIFTVDMLHVEQVGQILRHLLHANEHRLQTSYISSLEKIYSNGVLLKQTLALW